MKNAVADILPICISMRIRGGIRGECAAIVTNNDDDNNNDNDEK
jgi:hypothetical protein